MSDLQTIIKEAIKESATATAEAMRSIESAWLDQGSSARYCGLSQQYLCDRCNEGTGPKHSRSTGQHSRC